MWIGVADDVAGDTLELSLAHLLLLNLLDLLLDGYLILLICVKLSLSLNFLLHLRLSLHHTSLLPHLLRYK